MVFIFHEGIDKDYFQITRQDSLLALNSGTYDPVEFLEHLKDFSNLDFAHRFTTI